MGRENDLLTLINSLRSLIVFEKRASSLYEDVAERVDSPLVSSLLLHISLDGQKHSTVLKGITLSMPKNSWKTSGLSKELREAWRSMDAFQIGLSNVDTITEVEMANLCAQLIDLEKSLVAEYNGLLQLNALELLSEKLNNSYRMNLENLKTILLEALHDEEYHKEILTIIVGVLGRKEEEEAETIKAPTVKFQNPDAWSRPQPMTA